MKPIFTIKNLSVIALAAAMLFTFTACGGEKTPPVTEPATQSTGAPTVESTADTTPETTEATTPETTVETTPETTEATTPETTVETTPETTPETSEETQEPTSGNPDSYEITDLEGAVPASGKADPSYFNDAVFVGDSVSMKLSFYEAAVDVLGKAKFLTAGSLGSGNALWEVSEQSVHPVYKDEKMLIEDSISMMGAKKVYIMLGMNDIALYGVEQATANMEKLIDRILAKSPDAVIYIQSMTPITSTSNLLSSSGHNPGTIHAYNKALLNLSKARGFYFVDVASVMYDSNGYLQRDYCSDPDEMGIHFTNAGCAVWADYLLTHTAG